MDKRLCKLFANITLHESDLDSNYNGEKISVSYIFKSLNESNITRHFKSELPTLDYIKYIYCAFYILEGYSIENAIKRVKSDNLLTVKFLETSDVIETSECEFCQGTGEVSCDVCDSGDVKCDYCDDGQSYCDSCSGSGEMDCKECYGEGCEECDSNGTIKCDECDGEGTLDCDTCDSEGVVSCEYCSEGIVDCEECYGEGTIHTEDTSLHKVEYMIKFMVVDDEDGKISKHLNYIVNLPENDESFMDSEFFKLLTEYKSRVLMLYVSGLNDDSFEDYLNSEGELVPFQLLYFNYVKDTNFNKVYNNNMIATF